MLKIGVLVFGLLLASPWEDTVTLKGWLSDKGCAQSQVNGPDEPRPNLTTCVKKCLDEGATPVFVDPKSRTLYQLKDYPTLREDVGYHLEITGVLDVDSKTIAVKSVKRTGEVVNTCALPKKR